jgi:cobalt-zinc-cadmium efflux system outer membrane protein
MRLRKRDHRCAAARALCGLAAPAGAILEGADMRFMIISLLLSLSATAYAAGQELTLEEAERLFYKNSPEVRAARISLQQADADVFEAGAWPNPVAKYARESLGNGQKTIEETYSLSQQIDLLGRRGKHADAAEKRRSARGYFVSQETADRLAGMKRSYYRVLLLQESEKAAHEALSLFAETEAKMRARVRAGDIAESDLMKLEIERGKAERRFEESRLELTAEKAHLGLALGIPGEDISLPGGFPYAPVSLAAAEVEKLAFENRRELKGLTLLVASSASALSAEKRGILPAFEVEAGYRKSSEGFTGAVFGVSVPLPLFDRNRGGTVRARAESHAAALALEQGKKRLVADVSAQAGKIRSLQTRIAALEAQSASARDLTGIAGLAYEAGETVLLDLLDTLRMARELRTEYHAALYEHASSVAEFEALTGVKLLNGGDTK